MAILEVKNLKKNFGELEVLKGIDFSLEKMLRHVQKRHEENDYFFHAVRFIAGDEIEDEAYQNYNEQICKVHKRTVIDEHDPTPQQFLI